MCTSLFVGQKLAYFIIGPSRDFYIAMYLLLTFLDRPEISPWVSNQSSHSIYFRVNDELEGRRAFDMFAALGLTERLPKPSHFDHVEAEQKSLRVVLLAQRSSVVPST